MVTSLEWIKAYVPELQCTDQEFFDKMTLSGTKVEGWTNPDKNLEKIVVGKVLSIEQHPDANKLVICRVDVGAEVIQIVTGAPNLTVGDLVPVVLDGGKVAGGHDGGAMPEDGIRIKAGKLRGIDSNGMMCSIEEMGSDRNAYPDAPEYGIYIFRNALGPVQEKADNSETAKENPVLPGADAVDLLGMHDSIFEYEITSNRVDCYSILGIAREAAATFEKPFVPPVVSLTEDHSVKSSDMISVSVEAPDLCTRYTARVCTNIHIAESPEWMKRRLRNSGIRPINNLVDITNYVMLEYGQPMHAYDYDSLEGHKIIVRRAKNGDVFTTLDGQQRNLDENVLMICDGAKEVGIAGIMGGENSMITENVHTVLFEAATFDGTNIRKSSKRIGLRTDASGIFEKGLDPNNAADAIDRACQLMQELGCGTPAEGMVDVCSGIRPLTRIPFTPDKINHYLGTSVSREEMLRIFEKLELVYDEAADEVIIPSFRQDLKEMCDLSEEVARFSGYDNVPVTLPVSSATRGGLSFKLAAQEEVRDVLEADGYSEAITFSFESPKVLDKLRFAPDAPERRAIRIQNPLGEDYSLMRTTPLGGLLSSLSTNYNRRNFNVKLYELATTYRAAELPITDYASEHVQIVFGAYGDNVDFYSVKGTAEDVFEVLGLTGHNARGNRRLADFIAQKASEGVRIPAEEKNRVICRATTDYPFLHPGRAASVYYNEMLCGYIGEIHPETAAAFEIEEKVYIGVIDLTELLPAVSFERHFESIARFPAVTRDISMVVPSDITAGQIEAVILQRGGKILESYSLFDIYEGAQILSGFKSMAYNLVFRDKEKTLADDEVNSAMKKILNGLETLGIKLRS